MTIFQCCEIHAALKWLRNLEVDDVLTDVLCDGVWQKLAIHVTGIYDILGVSHRISVVADDVYEVILDANWLRWAIVSGKRQSPVDVDLDAPNWDLLVD